MCITLKAAISMFNYDNERKKLSTATMRYYEENLRRFSAWLTENKVDKINKLTKEIINDYILFLVRTIPNKTTINTYLRAIRCFVYYLVEHQKIKPISISLIKDTYKIKETFSNDEVEKILSSVKYDDETSVIMLLLLSTGMRNKTLCELRVSDVHLEDNYIDLKYTKSGTPLCPPLSQAVIDCLRDYISFNNLRDTDFLFMNRYDNPFNVHSLCKRINKRLKELGISKTGVHIFRHTFGKIMSMNGCPTAVLQKWLGHSDIKITQRYTDLYCNDLRNTIDIVPSAIFEYRK